MTLDPSWVYLGLVLLIHLLYYILSTFPCAMLVLNRKKKKKEKILLVNKSKYTTIEIPYAVQFSLVYQDPSRVFGNSWVNVVHCNVPCCVVLWCDRWARSLPTFWEFLWRQWGWRPPAPPPVLTPPIRGPPSALTLCVWWVWSLGLLLIYGLWEKGCVL